MIDIRYLSLDKLLYDLWINARKAPFMQYGDFELDPLPHIKYDINNLICNKNCVDLTTYYGRLLFIKIKDNILYNKTYDCYNNNISKKIVAKHKIKEMKKCILTYYKFY
jgi:hypothetical protein